MKKKAKEKAHTARRAEEEEWQEKKKRKYYKMKMHTKNGSSSSSRSRKHMCSTSGQREQSCLVPPLCSLLIVPLSLAQPPLASPLFSALFPCCPTLKLYSKRKSGFSASAYSIKSLSNRLPLSLSLLLSPSPPFFCSV